MTMVNSVVTLKILSPFVGTTSKELFLLILIDKIVTVFNEISPRKALVNKRYIYRLMFGEIPIFFLDI